MFHFFFVLKLINNGITKTNAGMENSNPPVTPVAKENQKGSSSPSMKKGSNPIMVEAIVRNIGIILWL